MREVIFTMGLPGAGKSTRAREAFPDLPVIDCDAFKASLPGYNPADPGAVHAESQRLCAAAKAAAFDAGASFISDSTGTNAERLVSDIRRAKARGYRVTLFYVVAPLSVALARNAARARNVAESVLRDKAETIGAAFDIVAPECDAVRIVYNG